MKKIKIIFVALVLFGNLQVAAQKTQKIVILHTNDTHSQVEPTDTKAKEPNMGGYARRMGVIDSIRASERNVLLLDAGDFFQGTPYFNFFRGRVEIDAMNRMRYDAATLGNHEFDNGLDTLAEMLALANFPVVDANYDVSATVLHNKVQPFIILERFELRIGIFGLSPDPHGLIFEKNYQGIIYKDPIAAAVKISDFLKKKEKCDLIICLSHIGSEDVPQFPNDFALARASEHIDMIIGGHSHTLLADNTTVLNKKGKPIVVSQMGKSGLYLGKIELEMRK